MLRRWHLAHSKISVEQVPVRFYHSVSFKFELKEITIKMQEVWPNTRANMWQTTYVMFFGIVCLITTYFIKDGNIFG